MRRFSFEDLAKKDFLASITMWVVLEVVSFIVFPALRLIQPGNRLQTWFWISVPLGLGGALLIGGSSQFVAMINDRAIRTNKPLLVWLGQAVGWVGITGILFPLLMVCIEFLSEVVRKTSDF